VLEHAGDEGAAVRARHARVDIALDVLVEGARGGGGEQNRQDERQRTSRGRCIPPFNRKAGSGGERDGDADADLEEVEDRFHVSCFLT